MGGSGYGGAELLRLLLQHPAVEIAAVTSRQEAGTPVWRSHPNLRASTDLVFTAYDPAALERCDVAFFALPHGEAMALIPELLQRGRPRIIDLSGDFRLKDAALYPEHYGRPHAAPDRLAGAVYAIPEFFGEELRDAQLVANPGCFATAAILALLPPLKAGLKVERVALAAATGSSGSGATPSPKTHHPERSEAYYAYKPLEHQHVPEILQAAARFRPAPLPFAFVTHSAPFVRGIHATLFLTFREPVDAAALRDAYRREYRAAPFVRVLEGPPDVRHVARTNWADLHVTARGDTAVVLCAIDNLVKGMAGNAVQAMNLVFRLPEDTGLRSPGFHP